MARRAGSLSHKYGTLGVYLFGKFFLLASNGAKTKIPLCFPGLALKSFTFVGLKLTPVAGMHPDKLI